MTRLKRLCRRLFCLPPLPTVLIALPSFALVIYALAFGPVSAALTYASYLLSSYALILSTTCLVSLVRALRRRERPLPLIEKVARHPLGERFLHDVGFRTKISLYQGVLINLAYVAVKAFSGFYYRSAWFLSLAGYYLLLVVMRFFLLRHFRESDIGQDRERELRRYRGCGIILLFMNQALMLIVLFMVHQNRGYEYPGPLIYAMAAYAFYAVIFAVVSLIKYRRHGSPVLSAAKIINLTAALVSMLSLETAMLAQFGGDDSDFRQWMTATFGGFVCTLVFAMAVFMLVRSTKQLKQLRREALHVQTSFDI